MAKTVGVVGIEPDELAWVRALLSLLRHPDPLVAEMVRHSLAYLESRSQAGASPLRDDAAR